MRWLAALAVSLFPLPALADDAGHHADPIAPVVLMLALILVAARLAGDVATRLKQPAVLGELLAGVALGNASLLGFHGFARLRTDPTLDQLARLGVLLLLFEVGLESTVRQMLRVGWSSLLVAVIGVAVPMGLGWGVGAWLLPAAGPYAHAFLGATLSATSVGITARVLQDVGRSRAAEARVILGAAVIDDVLGLVILAVVAGAIAAAAAGSALSVGAAGLLLAKALGFLVVALALGVWLSPRVFSLASRLHGRGVLVSLGLALCFALAWTADALGLAPIVGAFAAGLVLEDVHYRDFVSRGEHGLEELVRPISAFLVPVFFVLMGARTDLRAFADPGVVWLATVLTVAAIAGKVVAGVGALGGARRLPVGIGMVPRGEVGLIFASVGQSLRVAGVPVVSSATYSALVLMVIVTTLVTPPALLWSLRRGERASAPPPDPSPAPLPVKGAAPDVATPDVGRGENALSSNDPAQREG